MCVCVCACVWVSECVRAVTPTPAALPAVGHPHVAPPFRRRVANGRRAKQAPHDRPDRPHPQSPPPDGAASPTTTRRWPTKAAAQPLPTCPRSVGHQKSTILARTPFHTVVVVLSTQGCRSGFRRVLLPQVLQLRTWNQLNGTTSTDRRRRPANLMEHDQHQRRQAESAAGRLSRCLFPPTWRGPIPSARVRVSVRPTGTRVAIHVRPDDQDKTIRR